MRAKLVCENIGNILKPKSKEDIIKDLGNLSQKEKNKNLFNAIFNNNIEEVKLLIEAGANVNAKDEYGYIPLIIASANNYKEIVKLLIEANVNVKNEDAFKALKYSIINNYEEIVKLLIEAGVKLNNIK